MHGMVFTKIFRRLILGLWGATLCSCTTYRTLSIEILQPAGFHIEQGKTGFARKKHPQRKQYIDFYEEYS